MPPFSWSLPIATCSQYLNLAGVFPTATCGNYRTPSQIFKTFEEFAVDRTAASVLARNVY